MDLEAGIEHLAYEALQLRYVRQVLKTLKREDMSYSCFLDSFSIHAYCLYYFFKPKAQESDMVAKDFIPTITFQEFKEFTGGELKTKRNKQVAHLTWNRVSDYNEPRDKAWPIDDLYKNLADNLKIFVDELPKDLQEEFYRKAGSDFFNEDPTAVNDYYIGWTGYRPPV